MPHSTHGNVLLMGSGETGASMVEVHKYAMSLAGEPPRAAFIDTPAGFQLNAGDLAQRAVEYFDSHLSMPLEVASFRDGEAATREEMQAAVAALRRATYVFAGPGSPTYAIRNWRRTPVYDAIFETFSHGGCVAFASAAALTLGRWTIPVYEIYKVGGPLGWVDGLDLLGHVGLEVAVVPHWNNTSGGDHDTNFCFMGAPRWEKLVAMLPPSATVLGIDEHTACLLRIDEGICEVRGVGRVTVCRGDEEMYCEPGESFPLEWLRPAGVVEDAEADGNGAMPAAADQWAAIRARHDALLNQAIPDSEALADYVYALLDLGTQAREGRDGRTATQVDEALREAIVHVFAPLEGVTTSDEAIAPFVELLITVRDDLRGAQQWAAADRIREGLAALGVTLADGPDGTGWSRSA